MATTTPNMGLQVPEVGDTDYPSSIEESLDAIDVHDHSSGEGVQIAAAGIADGAVTTAKILDANVTAAKLAADSVTTAKVLDANITRPKLVAVGQQISSSSGAYTDNASAAFADVTNLSVTITTTGRPVRLELNSGGTVTEGYIGLRNASGSLAQGFFKFVRGGSTDMGHTEFRGDAAGTTDINLRMPPSFFSHLDVVAAGTYTYKVQAFRVNGTLSFIDVKLVAYEL